VCVLRSEGSQGQPDLGALSGQLLFAFQGELFDALDG
jgi:hypothetical protein